MNLLKKALRAKPIASHKTAWFLLLICFLFVIFRLPSLSEPHWYGDEGIYQVVGRAIDSGRLLYKDIWDNKPPLLYLVYAGVYGNLFLAKLLSLAAGLISIITFYMLSLRLFKGNAYATYISTSVYAILFGLPFLEGNIANAENFMLLPVTLAAYLLMIYQENKKIGILILSGFVLSLAFVTKVVALFDFSAFLIYLVLITRIPKSKSELRPFLYFALAFFSSMIGVALYFFLKGALQDFVSSVFFQNVSYVGDQNHFIFPLGGLFVKSVVLVAVLFVITNQRKKLSGATIFLYVWFAFSLYNTLFSERPYTHYLLELLPVFALLVGHIFIKAKTRIVDVVLIILAIGVSIFYFPVYVKTIDYYKNYIKFMTNQENITEYETFFDSSTPLNYEIANFIDLNVKGKEKVFLWSDSPQIYALSGKEPIGKYIVAYHITFYKNADVITKNQIEKEQPKFIIQTVDDPLINDILSSYRLKYIMEGAKIYEREI